MKLRTGVIGTGALGRHHTRIYRQNPNAELAGIYDVSREAAEKVAKEYGAKVFDSTDALAECCDALSIAVPADKHHGTAIQLLKKGKHLLIEKPITTLLGDAEELVRTAEKNGLVLGVGHVESYNPAFCAAEKIAGRPLFMEVHRLAAYPPPRPGTYRRGTEVGVVLDLMIHDLELVLRLAKSPVEKVEAVGMRILSPDEDIANARITFADGAIANVTASRLSQEASRRFRVFYKDSYVSLDLGKRTAMLFSTKDGEVAKENVPVRDCNALEAEIGDFVDSSLKTISTGKLHGMKASGRHGLDALRLALQVVEEIGKYSESHEIFETGR